MPKKIKQKPSPRLRTVQKVRPPFPLNSFPKNFGLKLGKEIIYILATKPTASLEGSEWEEIFANSISADWKPSNVGLDDVVLEQCAWGAKTVKNANPFNAKKVRLISGRNSPSYSFGEHRTDIDPEILGPMVLEIWNERVSAIRKHYAQLRTIVLIKSPSLEELVVFEFDTVRFDAEMFSWKWNKNKNLVGFDKNTENHKFTWQPHGSQFTIVEKTPERCLWIKVKKPPKPKKDALLENIGFDENWIEVTEK